MFLDIKKLLNRRLNELGVGDKVEAVVIVEAFKKVIDKRFGRSAAASINRAVWRYGRLEVSVSSSAMANELKIRQNELTDLLTAELDGKVIKMNIFG